MDAILWILLPGFVAVGSGLLAFYIMQSRMEELRPAGVLYHAIPHGSRAGPRAGSHGPGPRRAGSREEFARTGPARRQRLRPARGFGRVPGRRARGAAALRPREQAAVPEPQGAGAAGAHLLPQYPAFQLDRARD